MSVKVISQRTENFLFQEYTADWEITGLSRMKSATVQTPTFFPLPNINVSFCFVVRYQKMENYRYYLKLMFNKVAGSDIPQSLRIQPDIQVRCPLGCRNLKYASSSLISVHDMPPITCVEQEISYRYSFDKNAEALILNVSLVFYNHLGTPAENSLTTSSLNNLKSFVKDYTLFYRSPALSDITFRIGERTFPAHKFVLAAHSSTLLKILERDFFDSKTNCVIINDCKYKTFCSFLWYLYSGDIEDKSWSNVTELYTIANTYSVQTLKRKCAEIISASYLNADNVCKILEIAYACNDESLKVTAICFAVSYFQELVSTEEWNALVKRNPEIGYEVIAISKC